MEQNQLMELRMLVELYYDIQHIRIATSNRIEAYYQSRRAKHSELDPVFVDLKAIERDIDKQIKYAIKDHPLWYGWFKDVKGIGHVMAAGIISFHHNSISEAPTISAFWKYHGLAPGQKRTKGQKIDYNPRAKTHAWKVGMQLLKAKGKYSEIYYAAKQKYEQRADILEAHKSGKARGGCNSYKMHIHYMALRKEIKLFYAHTWIKWRQLENLSISQPYIIDNETELGKIHTHYIDPDEMKE